jgi:hypothetical protein
MQKFIAVAVAVSASAVAVAPASAAPAKFTKFSESVAYVGAHQYAREKMGAADLVTSVECHRAAPTAEPTRAVRWICSIETRVLATDRAPQARADVSVLRRGGAYVFRAA